MKLRGKGLEWEMKVISRLLLSGARRIRIMLVLRLSGEAVSQGTRSIFIPSTRVSQCLCPYQQCSTWVPRGVSGCAAWRCQAGSAWGDGLAERRCWLPWSHRSRRAAVLPCACPLLPDQLLAAASGLCPKPKWLLICVTLRFPLLPRDAAAWASILHEEFF